MTFRELEKGDLFRFAIRGFTKALWVKVSNSRYRRHGVFTWNGKVINIKSVQVGSVEVKVRKVNEC